MPDASVISLAALLVAIAVSCVSRANVGLLSIVLAVGVGCGLAGMKIGEVLAGFPVSLFLTLFGVTLLFTEARLNGTLDRVAHHAVRGCRGNRGLVPVMFFFLAAVLSTAGPGNIAAAAIVAPMAMAVAGRAGISAFLMAIMVGNGASAGSVSPLAPAGIVVGSVTGRIGLAGTEWLIYAYNLGAHVAVAFSGYLLFGGWRLFGQRRSSETELAVGAASGADSAAGAAADQTAAAAPHPGLPAASPAGVAEPSPEAGVFQRQHVITLAVIVAWIVSVVALSANAGAGALAGSILLGLLRLADEAEALRKVPWGVIVMVCGVTVLIALLEKTGGMDLFSSMLAAISTPQSATAAVALVTGLISVYSSTSGVVLPAFLPTVPGIIEKLGGGDPLALVAAMNIGSHLVDVSPLSTIGALCIASAAPSEDGRRLFYKLLAWGMSMAVVGAALSWLLFTVLR